MKDPIYIEKKVPIFKRKQFLTILMGLFIIAIMVLSVLEYSIQNNQDEDLTVTVAELEFTSIGTGWQAGQVLLSYDPTTLDTTEIPSLTIDPLLSTQKVYLSINPYDSYQLAARDFQTSFPRTYTGSCYEDNDQCTELPIRTCDNATTTTGVIVFRQANETVITYENNCLTIQGKDLLKLTDTLILDYYGER